MQEEKFTLKNGKIVTIRRVRATDYEAARDFIRQFSTESIFTNQYPGQPDIDREKSEKLYEREDNCFIAAFEANGRMVSISNFRVDRPGHPWSGRNCEFGISTLEEYCGQGLGTRLMALLEQEARKMNMHRIHGSVRAANRRAIGLYLKCGFEIDGCSKETAFINGQWHDEYYISKILE